MSTLGLSATGSALDAIDRHPIDEVGRSRAADPREQRQPRRHRLRAPAQRRDGALDAGARRRVRPGARQLASSVQSSQR